MVTHSDRNTYNSMENFPEFQQYQNYVNKNALDINPSAIKTTGIDEQSQTQDSDDDALTFSQELTTEGHTLGSVVTEHCGLADVYPSAKYPDSRIDSYLFTPCGYSANAVMPGVSGQTPSLATYSPWRWAVWEK